MDALLHYRVDAIRAKLTSSEKTLVEGVSFSISQGESLALIGETGSGKTMIAQSIMGVLPRNVAMHGSRIMFCASPLPEGKTLRAMLGRQIVYIPQNGHESLNPSRKVKYHLFDSLSRIGVGFSAREAAAREKLAQAGFLEPERIMEQYPFQLSGGMAQRVTIALALCSDAKLLIADEPTNGLDEEAKTQFLSQLHSLFPSAAKLVITHDISVAAMCSRVLVLCGGRVMETGMSSRVLSAPKHPYTQALMGALIANGMRAAPVLRKESGACPFYRRCPNAVQVCRENLRHRSEAGQEWWCSGI